MAEACLGSRVVRGPDWKYFNQDGGEGGVGTVVEIGNDAGTSDESAAATVAVQWDSGKKGRYRCGTGVCFDLRLYDTANTGVRHMDVQCAECAAPRLCGIRWHCRQCSVDLCSKCYHAGQHDLEHRFFTFAYSNSPKVLSPERNGGMLTMARGMACGTRVATLESKGKGQQTTGVVLKLSNDDASETPGKATVRWSTGEANICSTGHNGKVDIYCLEQSDLGYYYAEHLPVMTVEAGNAKAKTSIDGGLEVGSLVQLPLMDVDVIFAVQQMHGGIARNLKDVIYHVGEVEYFDSQAGTVYVRYDGFSKTMPFHPGILSRVSRFKEGDAVRLIDDLQAICGMQSAIGSWSAEMAQLLRETGEVTIQMPDHNVYVRFDSAKALFHPGCLMKVSKAEGAAESHIDSGGVELDAGEFPSLQDYSRPPPSAELTDSDDEPSDVYKSSERNLGNLETPKVPTEDQSKGHDDESKPAAEAASGPAVETSLPSSGAGSDNEKHAPINASAAADADENGNARRPASGGAPAKPKRPPQLACSFARAPASPSRATAVLTPTSTAECGQVTPEQIHPEERQSSGLPDSLAGDGAETSGDIRGDNGPPDEFAAASGLLSALVGGDDATGLSDQFADYSREHTEAVDREIQSERKVPSASADSLSAMESAQLTATTPADTGQQLLDGAETLLARNQSKSVLTTGRWRPGLGLAEPVDANAPSLTAKSGERGTVDLGDAISDIFGKDDSAAMVGGDEALGDSMLLATIVATADGEAVESALGDHKDKVNGSIGSYRVTCVHIAAAQNKAAILELLHGNGADMSAALCDGSTAVHIAALRNCTASITALHGCGAGVSSGNSGASTPLHLAALRGGSEATAELLRLGANPNTQDMDGDTPLHNAARNNHSSAATSLLLANCYSSLWNEAGLNAAHLAAMSGSAKTLEAIITSKPALLLDPSAAGYCPLHYAAVNAHYSCLQVLLSQPGSNVDVVSGQQETALGLAVVRGSKACVEILVGHKSKLETEGSGGNTPLHTAAVLASGSVCDDWDFGLGEEDVGRDPAPSMVIDMIEQTLSFGSECRRRRSAIACFLVKEGANLDYYNHKFETPLELCTSPLLAQIIRSFSPQEMEEVARQQEEQYSRGGGGYGGVVLIMSNGFPDGGVSPLEMEPFPDRYEEKVPSRSTSSRVEELSAACSAADSTEDSGLGDESLTLCVMCDKPAAAKFRPCGHIVTCEECCVFVKKCPQCAERVKRRLSVKGNIEFMIGEGGEVLYIPIQP